MLNQWDRWALHFDQVLKPHPEDAPYTYMEELLMALHQRFSNGDCVKLINSQTAAIRIQDMKFNEQREAVVVLFNYSDQNISDPVFADLETGALRTEPKLEGEGIAVSAHMVISLKSWQDARNAYLTILEDVPGLGRTKIEPFLTSEYKAVAIETFKDKNGKVKRYRPMPEFSVHQSQNLRSDLEGGTLRGIELVSYKNVKGDFDEEGYVEEVQRVVQIRPVRKLTGNTAVDVINRVKEAAKSQGFSNLRVRFNKEEGNSKSILIGTAREDAGDALYGRTTLINGFTDPLQQCCSEIRSDVAEKLLNILEISRGEG